MTIVEAVGWAAITAGLFMFHPGFAFILCGIGILRSAPKGEEYK
ncbi:MAG: hypothetical protein AAF517_12845 [Planctomycetota bacterium]